MTEKGCLEIFRGQHLQQHKKKENRFVIAAEQSGQELMILFSHDKGWEEPN